MGLGNLALPSKPNERSEVVIPNRQSRRGICCLQRGIHAAGERQIPLSSLREFRNDKLLSEICSRDYLFTSLISASRLSSVSRKNVIHKS